MKVGDLVKVKEVLHPDIHPVGIVLKVVDGPGIARHMWCLYMDGDYEVLEYDTEFEVLNENR